MEATVKKKLSKPAKIAIWAGSVVVGLFVLLMVIGIIGVATSPGGFEGAAARSAAESSAKASQKAVDQAVRDKADAAAKASQDAADVKKKEADAKAEASKKEDAAKMAADTKATAAAKNSADATAIAASKASADAAEKVKAEAAAVESSAKAKSAEEAKVKAAQDAKAKADAESAAKAAQEAAAAAKPAPVNVVTEAPVVAESDYADEIYASWLESRGVSSSTEILMQNPSGVQGYLVSAESPSTGTVVFTAQLTKGDVTKDELKQAAMAVLQLVGFDDESLTRVEIVTADSLVRGVANRRDSPLLNL